MATESSNNEQNLAERVGSGLAIAAMTARLLVPTEATPMGDTLWIAATLILAAIIYSVGRWQAGRLNRPDAFSIAITLIVLGHLISGAWILGTVGQKRWALNVMWEWVSLGATCFVLRGNRSAVSVLAAMFVVLAGHGIWQYTVEHPAMRAETDPTRIKQVLESMGIPDTEGARKLFADRLASLEPLGPFALTNTLGGFLAIGILFGVVNILQSTRSFGRIAVGLVALSPVAYCLVLTKSRTAVVGVVAGLVLYGIAAVLRRRTKKSVDGSSELAPKRGRWIGLLFAGIALAAVLTAVGTGGLDEEVIFESPKSLQYRLMYWQATCGVLQDSPLLGTGPGNFRQSYTEFKLAASSEEIADPHNMLLDAWCNGGLVALLGLLALIAIVVRAVFAPSPNESNSGETGGLAAGLVGFAVVVIQLFLTGQELSPRIGGLAILFVLAWLAVRFAFRPDDRGLKIAASIAAVGLMIHLLGAGGFEMPAVAQTMFLLVASAIPRREMQLEGSARWRMLLTPVLGVAAFAVCLWSAVVPVHRVNFHVDRGKGRTGRPAIKDFSDAEQIDSYCPRGARLFAETLMKEKGYASFVSIGALAKSRDRDPKSFRGHFDLAMAFGQNWRLDGDPEDLQNTLYHLQRAVNRYPTNSRLVGDLAIWQHTAELSEAQATADRALQLDDINRQNGHADRYLSDQYLSQLIPIAERKKPDTVELGTPSE